MRYEPKSDLQKVAAELIEKVGYGSRVRVLFVGREGIVAELYPFHGEPAQLVAVRFGKKAIKELGKKKHSPLIAFSQLEPMPMLEDLFVDPFHCAYKKRRLIKALPGMTGGAGSRLRYASMSEWVQDTKVFASRSAEDADNVFRESRSKVWGSEPRPQKRWVKRMIRKDVLVDNSGAHLQVIEHGYDPEMHNLSDSGWFTGQVNPPLEPEPVYEEPVSSGMSDLVYADLQLLPVLEEVVFKIEELKSLRPRRALPGGLRLETLQFGDTDVDAALRSGDGSQWLTTSPGLTRLYMRFLSGMQEVPVERLEARVGLITDMALKIDIREKLRSVTHGRDFITGAASDSFYEPIFSDFVEVTRRLHLSVTTADRMQSAYEASGMMHYLSAPTGYFSALKMYRDVLNYVVKYGISVRGGVTRAAEFVDSNTLHNVEERFQELLNNVN